MSDGMFENTSTEVAGSQVASGAVAGASLSGASAQEKRDFAAELRGRTMACRLRHEKLGIRKALNAAQTKQAAETFAAVGEALTARKRLIDTTDPVYRAVVNVRTRSGAYWKSVTTPYPEPGIRLIRRNFVTDFDKQMLVFRAELVAAVKLLQEKYEELRGRAAVQLGELFDASDYPERIEDEFALEWDYPSIEPPDYLKNLHPDLYEQECARVKGRFDEAVRLTEQAFVVKFQELVSHLAERLVGGVDGKPKVIRDSAVANLNGFFEEFRNFGMGDGAAGAAGELNKLIDQAQQVVAGVAPDDLRASDEMRNRIGAELQKITTAVDELLVARPKRWIDLTEEA